MPQRQVAQHYWGACMNKVAVLAVEDDVLIQMELEAALDGAGYEAILETSAEAVLPKLKDLGFSALITDINLLGEMTGWELARRARGIFPDLPVIYVTSVAADEWSSEGVPKSILIQKPFAPAQISTAVSQLLNAGDATLGE